MLGVSLPPLKHLGPLLVVWGVAMLLLVFIRDLGSSLMFFGGFLALVYVATSRLSFVAIGLAMFAAGAAFFTSTVGHVQGRIDAWQNPFDKELYEAEIGGSYQIAQSLFAQADGGLFGQGLGESLLQIGVDGPGLKYQLNGGISVEGSDRGDITVRARINATARTMEQARAIASRSGLVRSSDSLIRRPCR